VADGLFDVGLGFGAVVAGGEDAGFVDGDDGKFFAVPFVLDDDGRVTVDVVGIAGEEKAIFGGEVVIAVAEEIVEEVGIFGLLDGQLDQFAVGAARKDGMNVGAGGAGHAAGGDDDELRRAVAFEVDLIGMPEVGRRLISFAALLFVDVFGELSVRDGLGILRDGKRNKGTGDEGQEQEAVGGTHGSNESRALDAAGGGGGCGWFETPGDDVASVEGDTEKVGGDEAELGRAEADDADDGAVDGGHDPALPKFFAEQNGAENGEDAGKIVEADGVKEI
jgi:hypothetical protein